MKDFWRRRRKIKHPSSSSKILCLCHKMTETDMTDNTEDTNANWQSWPSHTYMYTRTERTLLVFSSGLSDVWVLFEWSRPRHQSLFTLRISVSTRHFNLWTWITCTTVAMDQCRHLRHDVCTKCIIKRESGGAGGAGGGAGAWQPRSQIFKPQNWSFYGPT